MKERSTKKGKPKTPQISDAERQRAIDAFNQQTAGLDNYNAYLTDSEVLQEWNCSYCGSLNMCASSTCSQCGKNRPQDTHADPEQGEGTELGQQRQAARFMNWLRNRPS